MNTPENNKLISIFDGQDPNLGLDYLSWERIMPVWFKILDLEEVGVLDISKSEIGNKYVFMQMEMLTTKGVWESKAIYNHKGVHPTMLPTIYKTIVEFLLWFYAIKK